MKTHTHICLKSISQRRGLLLSFAAGLGPGALPGSPFPDSPKLRADLVWQQAYGRGSLVPEERGSETTDLQSWEPHTSLEGPALSSGPL